MTDVTDDPIVGAPRPAQHRSRGIASHQGPSVTATKAPRRTRRPGRRHALLAAAIAGALLVSAGCTDSSTSAETDDTTAPPPDASLLGDENPATGEPVKIGQLTDGASEAVDSTDELVGGEIAAEYLNTYQGGIGGRPIEIVTCELMSDPSATQECANKMIAEDVIAVTAPQVAYADEAWAPLHDAGIPLVLSTASSEKLESDPDSTFLMLNSNVTLWSLPISLAESTDADKIAYVIVDVPQAREILDADDGETMAAAGLEFESVPIPLGTADMVPQMQQIKAGGAGVVHLLGNDTFCIAAIQGLRAVGYTGAISGVSQCFSDATRSALAGELEGVNVMTTTADGFPDDPSYEMYRAVVDEFGTDVEDIDGYTLRGYVAVATVGAALESLEGEVTAETVAETMRNMPETDLPVGGGITIKCGGSAVPERPAICTNQWLRVVLDADGNPESFTVQG